MSSLPFRTAVRMLGLTASVITVALLVTPRSTATAGPPPLGPSSEFVSKDGTVRFEFPPHFEEVAGPGATVTHAFSGHLLPYAEGKTPDLTIWVAPRYGASRLGLAWWEESKLWKDLAVKDSFERGEDWMRELHTAPDKAITLYRQTLLLRGGRVYQVRFSTHPGAQQDMGKELDKIAASFAVVGDGPQPPIPQGFTKTEIGPFDVWTDVKKSASVKKLMAPIQKYWELSEAVLPGTPSLPGRPRVLICSKPEDYASGRRTLFGASATMLDRIDYLARWSTLYVDATSALKRSAEYERDCIDPVAQWRTERLFGGPLPHFAVMAQLFMVATADGQDPEKPQAAHKKRAKDSWASLGRSFSDLLRIDGSYPDSERIAIGHAVWAWHWWFTYGKCDATYRDAYAEFLRALREDGDPAAAFAAFDGIDAAAMTAAFGAWLTKW